MLARAQANEDTRAAARVSGSAGRSGVTGSMNAASSAGGRMSSSSMGGTIGNNGQPTGYRTNVNNIQQV